MEWLGSLWAAISFASGETQQRHGHVPCGSSSRGVGVGDGGLERVGSCFEDAYPREDPDVDDTHVDSLIYLGSCFGNASRYDPCGDGTRALNKKWLERWDMKFTNTVILETMATGRLFLEVPIAHGMEHWPRDGSLRVL